jgi:acyl dehydratase/putative sterol carrier protein
MAGKIKADNMGDLMKFAQCFDMKKAAALAKEKAGGGEDTVESKVNQVFETMPKLFVPERAGDWNSVLHFDITGTGSWAVTVQDGQCTASKGKPESIRCNITYASADVLLDSVSGKINSQQAFMQGQIKADNMGDLMKFAQCFDMKKAAELAKQKGNNGDAAPAASNATGMNRAALGKTFRGAAEFVYPDVALAYANSTNDSNARYTNETDVLAPLLYPVRPFINSMGQAVLDKELNADILRLVHGEQDMHFYDTLKPWDLVAPRATAVDIEDKSSGQLLKVRQRLMRDGDVVCETISGFFVRAPKKPGEKKAEKVEEETPERDYIFESTYAVDEDQSYRYADSSLDKNPIHVDENTAKAAGHPGVILHGLCTMAMTAREAVNRLADGQPGRIKRLKVRFTKIVLPNDNLTTRAWLVDQNDSVTTYGLETTNQKGEVVLGNAIVEIAQ